MRIPNKQIEKNWVSAFVILSALLMLSSPALSEEMVISSPLFVPVASIDPAMRIYDPNHILFGNIQKRGAVFDEKNVNIGSVELADDERVVVRDSHYRILAILDESGTITTGDGTRIGAITGNRVSDNAGNILFRLSGPQDKFGLMAYLFLFSTTFNTGETL